MTTEYLARILERKREEVAALLPRAPELRARARELPPARPWRAALCLEGRVALIAEIKRRSPSAGSLRPDLDPPRLAQIYELAGAAAISVITDRDFDGGLDDLGAARAAISLPVLRKDFVLDPVQVWESRAAGADAVLLIVRALTDGQLSDLLGVSQDAGMGVLVEVHNEADLARAQAVDAEVIGVNNRDLETFATSLDATRRMAGRVASERVLVAESGIDTPVLVRELGLLGVDGVLVGQALVTEASPGTLAEGMAWQPKRART